LQTKDVTPARFFLVYIAFGMLSLLAIIAVSVYLRNLKYDVTWGLAISILVSNFLAVWGYALAILRRKELLSDPEAPDLAYYLGFSLTVGALSFSFLADLGALQAANPQLQASLRSGLVSGSLAQFGAGLLATLVGLSFKIYLTSQQQRTSSDPTEMYNQFRTEISSFKTTLRDLSSELSSSISQASIDIRNSGETASNSMIELAETLKSAGQVISVNITNERIGAPVDRFIAELESISTPLKLANEVIVEFGKKTNEANLAIKAAASEYLAASQVVRQSAISIDTLANSISNLNPDLEELNLKLGEFLAACYSGTSSLKALTDNTNLTALEILNNSKKLQELNPVVEESIQKLQNLSTDVSQLSQDTRLLSSCVLELVQGTTNANDVSGNFAVTMQNTAQQTINLVTRIDELSNACATGLNSLQDFQQATNTSAYSANNFAQTLQNSESVFSTATSNTEKFSESISQANTNITSYANEVDTTTQKFKQSVSVFVTQSGSANNALEMLSTSLDNSSKLTLGLNDQLNGLASTAAENSNSLQKFQGILSSTTDVTETLGNKVKASAQSIEDTTSQLKNLAESAGSANSEISKYSNSTKNLNVVAADQIQLADDHLTKSSAFIENYNGILNSIEHQQKLLGDLEIKLNGLIGSISNLSSINLNRQ
jgi:chromosome segregation ATPase